MDKNIPMTITQDDVSEKAKNEMMNSMDPRAIPNMDKFLNDVNDLINEVETDKMKDLAKLHPKEFEQLIFHKFNTKLPIKVIDLLLEEDRRWEHVDRLLDMCDMLKNVKKGNMNIMDAHKKFSEKLNEDLIYKKFADADGKNGKENFERKMAEEKNKL